MMNGKTNYDEEIEHSNDMQHEGILKEKYSNGKAQDKTFLRKALSLDSVFNSTICAKCVSNPKEDLDLNLESITSQNEVVHQLKVTDDHPPIFGQDVELESIPSQKEILKDEEEVKRNDLLSPGKCPLSQELLEAIPSQKDIVNNLKVVKCQDVGDVDKLQQPLSLKRREPLEATPSQKEIVKDQGVLNDQAIENDQLQQPQPMIPQPPRKCLSQEDPIIQIKLLHDLIAYQNENLESLRQEVDILQQHVRYHQDDKAWNAKQAILVELVSHHQTKTLTCENEQQKQTIQQLQRDVTSANVIIYEQKKTIFEHQQREEDELQRKPFLHQMFVRFRKRNTRQHNEKDRQQQRSSSSSKTSFSSRYSSSTTTDNSKLERIVGCVRRFASRLRRRHHR